MSQPDHRRGPRSVNRRQAISRMLGFGAVVAAPGLLSPAVVASPWDGRAAERSGAARGPVHTPASEALRPAIRPRVDWAGDSRAALGPLTAEDDVRFLLVHHTASTNDYAPEETAAQIRGFHDFHTGPERGWPDVAYNFFIDRFGGIWEARQGSIDGPVRGDATGGSQGFALLCSLIGNHDEVPVSQEQQTSLVALLAWLGELYGIDTTPGATTDFVSRGSNRWPAGTPVTTTTIAGHRDMSTTTCPGDLAYALIQGPLPELVTALRAPFTPPATAAPSPTSTTTTTTSTTTQPSTPPPTDSTRTATPATDSPVAGAPATGSDAEGTGGGGTSPGVVAGALGAAAVVAAAAARRMTTRPHPPVDRHDTGFISSDGGTNAPAPLEPEPGRPTGER